MNDQTHAWAAATIYRVRTLRQKGWHWWHQCGEPLVLSGLLLVAATLPLLVLLEWLSLQAGLRAIFALAWLAGLLLLPRLPRLLHQEHRRLTALAGVLLAALALLLIGQSGDLALPAGASPDPLAATAPHTIARLLDNGTPTGGVRALPLQQEEVELTFKSPPRISRAMFAHLLQTATGTDRPSPAAPFADQLYDILLDYELDPAVALAFFAQESQFCTTGVCSSHNMHSWGGNRAAYNPQRSAGIVRSRYGPFVSYASWEDGLRDWCELILYRYVGRGLDTVAKAIPVYAPAFDGNNPDLYINNVRRRVSVWRGRDPGPTASPPAPAYTDLRTALLVETFEASGLEYHPTWAFHHYVLNEARAGRPVGSPISGSYRIRVGAEEYAIQVFALDTLYTPLAKIEDETNWNDVRRLSDLLRQWHHASGNTPPVPGDGRP